MSPIQYLAVALVVVSLARGDNSTSPDPDTCGIEPAAGPWSAALEDWVTAERVTVGRHGRIMSLPSSQGYYVSDRIDLMPPPPPPQYMHHMHHRGPYPAHHPGPHHGPPSEHGPPPESPNARLQNQPARPQGSPPAQGAQGSMPYDEWQATPPPPPGAGKIVNRPPNPYKDQFKPSYPPPTPPQPIPVQGALADRADEARPPPPHKQVSETDLYLLGAIEKLVYRVDLMEKRLRKMEENVHYLVVGVDTKPEPCPSNFTRVGGGCYHISSEALNWKSANYACRKLKGHLLELDADERRTFISGLLTDNNLKGADYWTGGLNPGLLWIWSHSGTAVGNDTVVQGEGRCLALGHAPPASSYVYRGQDCALRHRFVCERPADAARLGNEIQRAARQARLRAREARLQWNDQELG